MIYIESAPSPTIDAEKMAAWKQSFAEHREILERRLGAALQDLAHRQPRFAPTRADWLSQIAAEYIQAMNTGDYQQFVDLHARSGNVQPNEYVTSTPAQRQIIWAGQTESLLGSPIDQFEIGARVADSNFPPTPWGDELVHQKAGGLLKTTKVGADPQMVFVEVMIYGPLQAEGGESLQTAVGLVFGSDPATGRWKLMATRAYRPPQSNALTTAPPV